MKLDMCMLAAHGFPTVFAVGKQCGHSIFKLWTQSERIGQLNEMLVNRPANAGKSPATR